MTERFRIAALADVPQGTGLLVEVAGHRIALFRLGDDVYGIGDRCSHAEASLSEGELFDELVECPRHGSEFDITTGEPHTLPATRPVPVYKIIKEGDDLFVEVEPIETDDE
ncbi:MAG: non-heme iron oxygenase ferredoxin subunit [Actinomycetota bacterium]|jgi:3-phenylpropionate/trans-cinnamate dioxygenase ferredoxin subunit|nr:non-heme iron oxygenase ferredoxin subunit [Actinomycetota bacterium]